MDREFLNLFATRLGQALVTPIKSRVYEKSYGFSHPTRGKGGTRMRQIKT